MSPISVQRRRINPTQAMGSPRTISKNSSAQAAPISVPRMEKFRAYGPLLTGLQRRLLHRTTASEWHDTTPRLHHEWLPLFAERHSSAAAAAFVRSEVPETETAAAVCCSA